MPCTCKVIEQIMKWDVKLYVAGSMFTEQVHARQTNYARCRRFN